MSPCEMNYMIAAISNQLYTMLDKEDFRCLSLFLNELSKSMFTMGIYSSICKHEHGEGYGDICDDDD